MLVAALLSLLVLTLTTPSISAEPDLLAPQRPLLLPHSPALLHAPRRHPAYAGNLSHVVCDVKTALNSSSLDRANAAALLAALATRMGCDSLRIPIMPSCRHPADYAAGYNATLALAHSMGLLLYASPMEGAWQLVTSPASQQAVGNAAAKYLQWLQDFAQGYGSLLTFFSPFNELSAADCDPACMAGIVQGLRASNTTAAHIVGPDVEHVDKALEVIKSAKDHFLGVFDILSSHNAGGDTSSSEKNWQQMRDLAGASQAVWSSENPDCFTLSSCTNYGTMAAPLKAGVDGIVSWETLGDDILLSNGSVTAKGLDLIRGLLKSGQ